MREYETKGRPRKQIYKSGKKNNERRKKRKRQKRLLLTGMGVAALGLLFGLFMFGKWLYTGFSSGTFSGKIDYEGTHVIAIDPGHGGKDLGASGITDEVEVTERTAKYLYKLLEKDERFTPLLCREYGEGATAGERGRYAAKMRADLLLSIHGNAGEPDVRGFEVYPVPPGRERHEESVKLAGLIAQEFAAQGALLRGENGIRYVYYEEDDSNESVKVFKEFSDPEISEAQTFGVLEEANCPAVLVEQCFVTNAEDFEAFASKSGSEKAANAYYKALCNYYFPPA